MTLEKIVVPESAGGERLDHFMAHSLGERFSRSKIKDFIRAGKVMVNGICQKPSHIVAANQVIEADLEQDPVRTTSAEDIPIDIVFEDSDLLVVNKPAGMVVHPATGNLSGTLVNALLHHVHELSRIGGGDRAGIVHRLDKETSGLLIVAKNDLTHRVLADQFKDHRIEKVYWAVVKGVVHHDEMRSEEPVGRSYTNPKKVIVRPDGGKESRTNFKVLKRFKTATLLEVRPQTGRTHQIRVHLRYLGFPVLGDKTYGVASPYIARQALHAKSISFMHPLSNRKISIDTEVPEDLAKLLKDLDR